MVNSVANSASKHIDNGHHFVDQGDFQGSSRHSKTCVERDGRVSLDKGGKLFAPLCDGNASTVVKLLPAVVIGTRHAHLLLRGIGMGREAGRCVFHVAT